MSKQENIGYPVVSDQIVPNQQSINQPGQYQMHNAEQPLDFTLQAHPVPVTCPHCKKQGVTMVKSRIGLMQWLICLVLCLMGFWCCCCIPCYISDLREASHSCQHCGSYLGSSQIK